MADGSTTGLKDASGFKGYTGDAAAPNSVLLAVNNLHIDIIFDKNGVIGATDAAGINDIVRISSLNHYGFRRLYRSS